jgi:putative DNA primase/helicase
MAVLDSNNHQGEAPGPSSQKGGNGQGILDRPISELSNEELAKAKEEIREGLKLQEAAGAEAAAASEKFRRIIEEIAALPENQFEIRCKEIAKGHGVSVALLRKWWRELHQITTEHKPGGGRRVELPLDDPWPEAVSTSELLATIMGKLREYVVLQGGAAVAVGLYTMLTYVVDELQLCPMLLLRSAVKRSGKTTLLGLLLRMSYRALGLASISAAALYRVVDSLKPTLLLDEVDATLAQKTDTAEALRGLLNAGNDRTSSRVLRCVGEDKDVVSYEAFGAKVLAGIGEIPDTMEDRSVIVELRRKLENEKVRRFSVLDDQREFREIRQKLLRWATQHRKGVGAARPQIPFGLNDRASDNWSPLLAIADLAGEEWGRRARAVALELSGGTRDDEQDIRFELLKDIRAVFIDEGGDACKAITTSFLIEKLCQIEEAPWATFHRGEPINPRGLGRILRPFGIVSANLKISRDPVTDKDTVAKGYKRETFIDAWMRYLPLPATRDEKGHETQGNRENVRVAVADGHPLPVGIGADGVADRRRYRYPTATKEKGGKGHFSVEIHSDGAGGSGVADKKGSNDKCDLTGKECRLDGGNAPPEDGLRGMSAHKDASQDSLPRLEASGGPCREGGDECS